jgi:uncharacterized protein (TIGR02271 family)
MKTAQNETGIAAGGMRDDHLERLFDSELYDRNGEHLGKINAVWTDQTGQPAFLGVRTPWLVGKTHLVPAYGVDMTEDRLRIRVPYTKDQIKEAPSYDPNDDLSDAMEAEVIAYYESRGLDRSKYGYQTGIEARAETAERRESTGAAQSQDEASMTLSEEEVKIGKRRVEVGGVRLRKVIRTETVNQPVELQREEIEIERVPAEGAEAVGPAFEGNEVFIPLRREEPVVEKKTRAREQVRARKKSTVESGTVSETVRKEDVEVVEEGGARENRPRMSDETSGRGTTPKRPGERGRGKC